MSLTEAELNQDRTFMFGPDSVGYRRVPKLKYTFHERIQKLQSSF